MGSNPITRSNRYERGTCVRRMSVDSLLNRYKLAAQAEGMSKGGINHVTNSMRYFSAFLGGIEDVKKVTADDLRRFLAALRQRQRWQDRPTISAGGRLSQSTINNYYRGVRRFYSWLQREGILKDNPIITVRAPKLPTKLPRVLTEDELQALFKAARANEHSWIADRDEAILSLLIDTGIRLGELVNLNRDDFKFPQDTLMVTGKGSKYKASKQRLVPLSKDTEYALNFYVEDSRPLEPMGEDKLFLCEDGRPFSLTIYSQPRVCGLPGLPRRVGLVLPTRPWHRAK